MLVAPWILDTPNKLIIDVHFFYLQKGIAHGQLGNFEAASNRKKKTPCIFLGFGTNIRDKFVK